jgi:hypothetical protein
VSLSAGVAAVVAAIRLVVPPIALLALAALVGALLAVRRNGTDIDRVIVFLGLGAVGWIAVQVGAGVLGFPVTSRFLFAPAAVISVLGGVGFGRMARTLKGKARTGAIALSVALIVTFAIPRIEALPARLEGGGAGGAWPSVVAALRRSKAQGLLEQCGNTIYAANVGGRRASEIPWRLDIPARAVHPLMTSAALRINEGIVVIGKDGPAIIHLANRTAARGSLRSSRKLASAGKWSVYEVGCRPGR